jgi:ketosteroid isomerase-like protein
VSAVAVVREVYEAAVERGPGVLLERWDEWCDDDFEWSPILLASVDGRTYRGKAAFAEYWAEFNEAFPDVQFEKGSFESVDDETVLVISPLRGSGAGSGVPIDRTVAYVFTVRNGRMTSGRTFFSPAEAREYLAHA